MVKFTIPIRLPSLANLPVHYWGMARIKKGQRKKTKSAMKELVLPLPPVIVTIIRLGPRRLDDDNLASSCKYVRDQIAAEIGVDDGSPLYTWRYEQRTGKYSVEVEITPRSHS